MTTSASEQEFATNSATVDAPATEQPLVQQAAEEYVRQGISVCRIRFGQKLPTDAGWTTHSAESSDFRPDDGIGFVCGWPSNGGKDGQFLVAIDLDTREATEKADQFLPVTGAIEGRASNPRSHRWYFVTDVPDHATSKASKTAPVAVNAGISPGPFTRSFRHRDTKKEVLKFIGTGAQANVPPSLHHSGEFRRWEEGCSIEQIATVPFTELWDGVCRLAESCGAAEAQGTRTASSKAQKAQKQVAVADPTEPVVPAERAEEVRTVAAVPSEERERRCDRYLKSVDLARSWHGGHDATYRVAKIICNDFAITNRETALRLLRVYNERLKVAGEDVWSDTELEHKITDALNAPVNPQYPLGCKLSARSDETPRAWDDPARLAEDFLRERTVRFVKKTAFEYRDGTYRVASGEWLTATVRKFIERAAEREGHHRRREQQARRDALQDQLTAPLTGGLSDEAHIATRRAAKAELVRMDKSKPVVAPAVNRELVRNTIEAVTARRQLPDDTELDSWIGGRSGAAVLCVANGLLDPVARTLAPHSVDWFATARLPVAYDPDAPAPERWLAFLNDVMEGDAERIAVLQELFGASLDRSYPAKWFGALVGSGDNGKTVALVVLRSLLGAANCSAVNLDELSNNRFAAFQMFGKLANVVGDQGHFESSDEGRLKSMTGGDLVAFEQKGRDSFVAVNRAKLIFACNAMPSLGDKSEAIWNRLIAVPFEYTVPREKKNPALLTASHWGDELPGILNWALDGLARLRAQGGRFTRSEKCEAAKKQTRTDSNPARLFLLEECVYTGNDADKVAVSDLFGAYQKWCAENGFTRPLTQPKFGKEARSVFPSLPESKVVREGETTHRCWIGLKRAGVSTVL